MHNDGQNAERASAFKVRKAANKRQTENPNVAKLEKRATRARRAGKHRPTRVRGKHAREGLVSLGIPKGRLASPVKVKYMPGKTIDARIRGILAYYERTANA